jgi:two-component system cell cycle response regulator CtrA
MRVLLIEDEATIAKSIELMLGTEGFNVYTTDLGEEGLDLGKLYDYDIILLDLNLPDMHGYDVLKKLRTAKVSTPVLILSGISEMDSKVRSFGFSSAPQRRQKIKKRFRDRTIRHYSDMVNKT